jgi:hypothetical protein
MNRKKTYVKIKIEENAMKHLTSKFKKDFIKSFLIVENVFDDLNKVFDDSNKRVNVLKTYKRLKKIKTNKKFHIFWTEFQRLTSNSEFYDEKILLKNLKDKMFWDSSKNFNIRHLWNNRFVQIRSFVSIINQMLRDVNTKFKNIREEYEKSILKKNLNNQESSREQSNTSNLRFRFETFKSNTNNNQKSINREINRSFAFSQVNAFIC